LILNNGEKRNFGNCGPHISSGELVRMAVVGMD
jgi:hypothetical protein